MTRYHATATFEALFGYNSCHMIIKDGCCLPNKGDELEIVWHRTAEHVCEHSIQNSEGLWYENDRWILKRLNGDNICGHEARLVWTIEYCPYCGMKLSEERAGTSST
jgi:hypothetical protein